MSLSIKLILAAVLTSLSGVIFWLFTSTPEPVNPPEVTTLTTTQPIRADNNSLSGNTQQNMPSSEVSREIKRPAFVNVDPISADLPEFIDPEEMLEFVEQAQTQPISIGEFIDPDDENYQYEVREPISIGEFIDPDDESYQYPEREPISIGEFIDPDDENFQFEPREPISIGEFIDPDDPNRLQP